MGKGMLPINTMRDLIRTNQFFASSALILASAIVGFSVQSEELSPRLYAKLLCLACLQAANFVCFMHATRFLCHCEILINAPDINGVPVTSRLVARVFARSTEMWSIGLKGLMLTVPALLWLFGPLFLVLGMLALCAAWRLLDWDDFGDLLDSGRREDEAQQELRAPAEEELVAPVPPQEREAATDSGQRPARRL